LNTNHILNKDYYEFNSFRHVFNWENRNKDLKLYNERCGLNISFDLFLDEDYEYKKKE